MKLVEKINQRTAKVGIIGLGYVGLPLVMEFCKAGFHVTGFDNDPEKIASLKAGKSYIGHIPSSKLCACEGLFSPTADFSLLPEMDAIVICLPTPLDPNREPDMSFVFGSAHIISKHLKKGQLVVLESTTYPGTTDGELRDILQRSGLVAGKDFHLAYSPEREDPNSKDFSTGNIPKVVGGYTEQCLRLAKALYDAIVTETVPVSSTAVAEASKLLENIYRAVNIAMVNELKMLFDRMDIDLWEVIEAAKSKPFGFQPFYPGPGLGGHCIPVDPFYLTWKAREFDFSTRFIELAGEINTNMPYYVADKVVSALGEHGKALRKARVLLLGLAYKKDVADVRESPSLKVLEILVGRGAIVDYNDPHVPEIPKMRKYAFDMKSVPLENIGNYDCVVILTDHSDYDPQFIAQRAKLIVDTRNLIKDRVAFKDKVRRA